MKEKNILDTLTLSKAQRRIAERMQAGGALFLDPKTGFYSIKERGNISKLDQRPVEAMLLSGALQRDAMGFCTLALRTEIPASKFSPGQAVRWMRSERGELKEQVDAEVISATGRQVRIKTSRGTFQVVRPGALIPGHPAFHDE
ncbi:MAG: hypothetical protein FD131_4168 [Rhodocyclaceae bacterium]|nr:MAG: hypothetical protein FD131_4168 [Rhodocyclaceae bacterium]